MEGFIEGLKNRQPSKRTQERLKIFNDNIHLIYRSYGQSRPYQIKQPYIRRNNIKFIEYEADLHQVAKKGVIVGRIYMVIDSKEPFFDHKNLSFQGSCFLVTADIAVCCSHQIMKDRDYIVRIDNRFIKLEKPVQIKVKKILQNFAEKTPPGQTKSDEYTYLVLETDGAEKKTIGDYLVKTKMTTFEGIENQMFNFEVTIYGYFEKLPKQLNKDLVHMKTLFPWTPRDFIASSGTAEYSNNELSYYVSTEAGFFGAPIVLQREGNSYIVGIHTRGSYFDSKNYGVLFDQGFFHHLKNILNEVLGEKEGYCSLQNRINIIPLGSIVEYKTTLKNRLQAQ